MSLSLYTLSTPSHIFGQEGPIAIALASSGRVFEARPEQIRMAEAVARALKTRDTLLVEAGTGVGKSFAYLVPAMLRCMLYGERVVVATNTIALQEQIIEKDIPFLQSTVAGWGLEHAAEGTGKVFDLKPVLVKGRGNYLSIRRLGLASQRQDRLFTDAAEVRSLHAIEDWAYDTTDGTLATLPMLERGGVWSHAQSDADNCMGRKCPKYRQCFYQNARREVEKANLFICNHALFFADLALRLRHGGILPEYNHVILDEAHGVEDVASEHLGFSLSQGRVWHLLKTLYDPRRQKGYLDQISLMHPEPETVDGAIRLVIDAHEAMESFFDEWRFLVESGRIASGRVTEPDLVENSLTPVMKDLALRLKRVKEPLVGKGEGVEQDLFELTAYARRAAEIGECAELFCKQSAEEFVYWVEMSQAPGSSAAGRGAGRGGRGRGGRITLAMAPVEVGPFLRSSLFSPEDPEHAKGMILTSATLATAGRREHGESAVEGGGGERGGFGHIASRLGIDEPETLLLGSPFDHAAQMRLIVERDMPPPSGSRGGAGGARSRGNGAPQPTYEEALAERIVHHVVETAGGAFVLFTSFATLNRVAELAEPRLLQSGLTLFVQGRDGARTQMLARFREIEDVAAENGGTALRAVSDAAGAESRLGEPCHQMGAGAGGGVLFGAASFWQGVDVQGEALRNVIITRLPFEPPDRPLTQARLDRIKDRGGDPFREDSIPRAVIRFKQGVGRLIRSRRDTGRVVVLDPRIVTTSYGRAFLAALPEGVKIEHARAAPPPRREAPPGEAEWLGEVPF